MLNSNQISSTLSWRAFIRTISLLVLLILPECGYAVHIPSNESLGMKCSGEHSQLNLYRNLLSPSVEVCYTDESETAELNQKTRRPKCTADKGCDIPLHCHNYTSSDTTLGSAQVLSVTPIKLQSIVENQNISNNCVMVMFYAPWCEHCVQFARRYNTVGRMFRELPVLAVDLSVNDP